MSKTIRNLVLNGGGIFGQFPLIFLKDVNFSIEKYPQIDVISGTSIGGILALALAYGYSAEELYKLFPDGAKKIFSKSIFRSMNPFCSKYPSSGMDEFLNMLFGDATLKDLKCGVVIPSINFRCNKPKVFDNFENDFNTDLDTKLCEVAKATSAAPTYFPPVTQDILIDGGILENSPLVTSLATILDKHPKIQLANTKKDLQRDLKSLLDKHKIDFNEQDIVMLARILSIKVFCIGTGQPYLSKKTLKSVESYSAIHWLNNLLLPYITVSNEIGSDFWMRKLPVKDYTLFNPCTLDKGMALDSVKLLFNNTLEKKAAPFRSDFLKQWADFILD